MKDSPRHIYFIDCLRGVAILSVFLYHCLMPAYGIYTLPWHWLNRGFDVPWSFIALLPLHFGFIGVPIFFVVSGFCIHLSFERQGREWGSFFIRRFFRIYPAYVVAVLIFSFLYAHTAREFWSQFGYHALLLHNYNPGTFVTLGGAFWSIAIEAQLYLLYPLLLALVAKWGWKRTLIGVATCEILLQGWDGMVYQFTTYSGILSPFLLHTISPFVDHYLRASPLEYWCSWSLGAFVADAFLNGRPMPLAKSSTSFWVFLVVASYFIAALNVYFFLLSALLTTRVIGNCLKSGDLRIMPAGFWVKHLRLIGIWSYSVYLLHAPLLEFLGVILRHRFPAMSPFFIFLCCVSSWAVILPLAGIWYRTLEQPGIAVGKALIRKMADKKVVVPVKTFDG